jgi:hypothetical protein
MQASIRQLLVLVAIAGWYSYLASVRTRPEGDLFVATVVGVFAVAVLVGSTVILLLGASGVIGHRR